MHAGFSASPLSCTSAVQRKPGTKSQNPFPKNKKRPHPWGRSNDAPAPPRGPARPARRPRGLRWAQLSRVRGATWWPQHALRAPLGSPTCPGSLPSPSGENRSPWVTVSVGHCGRPSYGYRTEAWDPTDVPRVSLWPKALLLRELQVVSYLLIGDISITYWDAREN